MIGDTVQLHDIGVMRGAQKPDLPEVSDREALVWVVKILGLARIWAHAATDAFDNEDLAR